jgi:precorrin-2 dehydrogenase/sirohydrochlorin ferrochelatase
LVLAGAPCLVVGGGGLAASKAADLVDAGAAVHIVAEVIDDAVKALAGVTFDERPYREGEVAGYRLVIAATGEAAVDDLVFGDASAAGVWINTVDDPARCTFTLPARVRRGALLLTVSTDGTSPAVSSWLRRQLEGWVGPEYGVLLDLVAEERERRRATGASSEGLDWQSALDSGMLELVREGRLAEAKDLLQTCLSSSSG